MNIRTQRVLLEPVARTATTNSIQQNDYVAHSVRLYFNVTAFPGTGLTFELRGYDKKGNVAVLLADGTAVTTTGMYVYELGPAVATAGGARRATLSAYLPWLWDVNIVHADGAAYNYSVTAEITS